MADITPEQKAYFAKLKDPRWQKKRLGILERDGFKCRECGDDKSELHVHHCLYIFGNEPWDYKDDELITLCGECHEYRGSLEHDVTLEFKRLMAKRTSFQLNVMMDMLISGLAHLCIKEENP